MADPFFDVKAEVESSLLTLSTLHSSYARILRTVPPSSHASSEELSWALSELKATLAAIELDVDELDESVAAVSEPGVGARLGIASAEIADRKAFLERVKREIALVRQSFPSTTAPSADLARKRLSAQGYTPPGYVPPRDDDDTDPNAEFEMQHQTLLMGNQDRILTDISGTVGLLREQAKVMGREVLDQNAMLDELDTQVDRTGGRLGSAQRKMDKFIKANQNSASSWAIFGLIIILCILLFILLFV